MACLRRLLTILGLAATLTAAVPASTPAGPTQTAPVQHVPISNSDAEHIISDAYIVVYHDNITDTAVTAHQAHWATTLAKRNIGKRSTNISTRTGSQANHPAIPNRPLSITVRTFSIGSMRAMALDADASTAVEVQSADEVAFLEADAHVYLTSVVEQGNSTTGLARLSAKQTGQRDYFYDDSAGQGVTAFVVDSGIMIDHVEFEGRAEWGFNAVNDNNTDENGHGSHVAGTIGGATFGVAKKISLVAVKVADVNGTATLSGLMQGLDYVYNTAIQRNITHKSVVNLSMGASYSSTINTAMTALRSTGLLPVVAAGNNASDASLTSPASSASALTVGAIDQATDARAWFSNFGPAVDIWAPGVNVVSVGIYNTTAVASLSGTSMACPHVAGLAAYFMGLGLRSAGAGAGEAGDGRVDVATSTSLPLNVTGDVDVLVSFVLAVAGVGNVTAAGEMGGSTGLIANNLLDFD
ncbi:protease [Coniella lustricola]|uniref:Protease n=1 Tax=Coniella lustricola TaxID=2025994 RepID=A0A2T3AAJ6_9PEZI|nr:protease [Coniella lustricola]